MWVANFFSDGPNVAAAVKPTSFAPALYSAKYSRWPHGLRQGANFLKNKVYCFRINSNKWKKINKNVTALHLPRLK